MVLFSSVGKKNGLFFHSKIKIHNEYEYEVPLQPCSINVCLNFSGVSYGPYEHKNLIRHFIQINTEDEIKTETKKFYCVEVFKIQEHEETKT